MQAPPLPTDQPPTASVLVSGPRPTPRVLAHEVLDVVRAAPLFVFSPLLRPWHVRWGATDAEVAAAMPGDEIVRRCGFHATRAITIDAPPTAVWPWLVQVGFSRAGYYSNDLLDNQAHPSAERIVPEWQTARVGDWVPMYAKVSVDTAFRIAELEPPQSLLWTKPDSTWAWTLTETDDGGTRLVTRLRGSYDWSRPVSALITVVVLEFADFPMMRRMLLNIRRRAEGERAAQPRRGRRVAAMAAVGLAGALLVWRIGRR